MCNSSQYLVTSLKEAALACKRVALVFAVAISLSGLVSGCSSISFFGDDDEAIEEIVPDETLYRSGLALLKEEDYSGAVKKFEQLERQHPYSEMAPKSLLMVAYSNYARGKYDDAISAGRRYSSLYPGNEDTAYALYLVGDSYYKQIKSVTQDQENTNKALEAFNELIEQFPESKYAAESREKVLMSQDHLAGKEMSVGRYYLNQHRYLAAVSRFRTVVDKYQNTRHIEESLARLTEAYLALGVVNEAQTAAALLAANYPKSPWYRDSYNLLQGQNLLPKVDPNSWLAEAGKDIAS